MSDLIQDTTREALFAVLRKRFPFEEAAALASVASDLRAALADVPAVPVQPITRWYMRDNHTFLKLPDDDEAALAAVLADFDAGNTYGMLSATQGNKGGISGVVHAGPSTERDKFAAAAKEWLAKVHTPVAATPAAVQPEPVAVVEPIGDGQVEACLLRKLPVGTKLYAVQQGREALPPLPAPLLTTPITWGNEGRWWSESQMQEYARAAIAPTPQAPQPTAKMDTSQPWTAEHCRNYPRAAAALINELRAAASLLPAQAPAVPSDEQTRAMWEEAANLCEMTYPELRDGQQVELPCFDTPAQVAEYIRSNYLSKGET